MDDKDKAPKAMMCEGGCRQLIKRLHLHPTIEGVGWQSSVGCHCFDCFAEKWDTIPSKNPEAGAIKLANLSVNQWSEKCKAKWAERLGIIGKYRTMTRHRSWKAACDDIDQDDDLKRLPNKQKRMHLKALANHHMNLLKAAFLDMTQKEQAHVLEGFGKAQEDINKMDADSFHVPQLEDHELNNWLLHYVDNIDKAGKMSSFFFCRHTDCLYTCRSTDWPNTEEAGGAHYWCPMCARLYEPWHPSATRAVANKLMVYKMDDTRQEQFLAANATAASGERFRVVPYLWLDTIGQNLEDRFKRVASGIMEEIKQISPEQRLDYVVKKMEQKSVHALFGHDLPNDGQKRLMMDRNDMLGKKQPKRCLDLAKYEDKGSYGRFTKEYLELLNDPITEDQMMRNWIYAKVSCLNAIQLVRI